MAIPISKLVENHDLDNYQTKVDKNALTNISF